MKFLRIPDLNSLEVIDDETFQKVIIRGKGLIVIAVTMSV